MVLSSWPLSTCESGWAVELVPQLPGLSFCLLLQSCGDSSPDTFSDGLSSSTLPDDHSSYTAQGYMGQDLEVERALTPALSPCAVSSTLPDWHIPVEIVPDSTSDLYNFQVSPMPSTSEGLCFWGLTCSPDCLGPGRVFLREKRCSELHLALS